MSDPIQKTKKETAQTESPEEFEARMIKQFNERVNKVQAVEQAASAEDSENAKQAEEHNGPAGLEPTRYGDWEAKGRTYDF